MSIGFTGKFAGALRPDLELLSRAGNRNAASIEELSAQMVEMQELIAQLTAAQSALATTVTAKNGIDNLLRASDFDHSELSWNGGGLSADELVFWRRGLDDAQRILPSSTSPKWDKTNGWLELSSVATADDLSYNFSSRIFRPGVTVFLQFLARLKEQANAPSLTLEAGLWDKTSGIDTWLSGSVTGASGSTPEVLKVGSAAATTTWGYKVVAIGADGSIAVSAEGTVSGAGTLNVTDYNQVRWASVAGVVEYRVYRTTGGVAGRIATITSGALSYNDQGTMQISGEAVPTAAPQSALAQFSANNLALTTEWQLRRAEIKIPSSWNFSATGSGAIWFRLGLRGTVPSGNAVLLDRLGLSFGFGAWSPAIDDRDKPNSDTVIAPIGWNDQPSYVDGYSQYGGAYDLDRYPSY